MIRFPRLVIFFLIVFSGLIPLPAAPPDASHEDRTLDGYMQIRYRTLDSDENSFDIRRARISLKGASGPRIGYKVQAELGGTKQKLLDAEMNIQIHKALQLGAGQFKLPISLENLKSSSRMNSINRSRVVEALTARSEDVIGNQNGRDIGIKMYGAAGKSDALRLEYTAALMNGSGINRGDLNTHKDFIGRVVLSPAPGISAGASVLEGKAALDSGPDHDITRRRIGAECSLRLRRAGCTAEWIRGQDAAIKKEGGYIEVTGQVMPEKIEALLKYDIYTPDISQDAAFHRWTIGLNGRLSPQTNLQVNAEFADHEKDGKYSSIILQLQSAF